MHAAVVKQRVVLDAVTSLYMDFATCGLERTVDDGIQNRRHVGNNEDIILTHSNRIATTHMVERLLSKNRRDEKSCV